VSGHILVVSIKPVPGGTIPIFDAIFVVENLLVGVKEVSLDTLPVFSQGVNAIRLRVIGPGLPGLNRLIYPNLSIVNQPILTIITRSNRLVRHGVTIETDIRGFLNQVAAIIIFIHCSLTATIAVILHNAFKQLVLQVIFVGSLNLEQIAIRILVPLIIKDIYAFDFLAIIVKLKVLIHGFRMTAIRFVKGIYDLDQADRIVYIIMVANPAHHIIILADVGIGFKCLSKRPHRRRANILIADIDNRTEADCQR